MLIDDLNKILVASKQDYVKDDLNRDVWKEDDHLDDEIRARLEAIANDFIVALQDLLDKDFEVLDITMTGSLANYTWTPISDIDLHVIVDFEEIGAGKKDHSILREMFNGKTGLWNLQHDIQIKGHEVEIYVQDDNEPHHSTGVYSIINDDWVHKPIKQSVEINEKEADKKAQVIAQAINDLEKVMEEGHYEEAYNTGIKLSDKIKKMRRVGLQTGGEFSPENLAFKNLRRDGSLEKLSNIKIQSYDSEYSMESKDNA